VCFLLCFHRYIAKNVKSCEGYRTYDDSIPEFLKNRPAGFVNEVRTSLTRAVEEQDLVTVTKLGTSSFTVNSNGKKYNVNFGDETTYPSCECFEWRRNRTPCKHFCAIFLQGKGKWEDISSIYTTNPLFSLDVTCFEKNTSHDNVSVSLQESLLQESPSDSPESDGSNHMCPLPGRRRSVATVELARCRMLLKEILSATYLIKDTKSIFALSDKVKELHMLTQTLTPTEEGVALAEKQPKRKASNKRPASTMLNLEARKTKKGRPKNKYSGRVGSKADLMRKTYKVKVPVPTASDPTKTHSMKVLPSPVSGTSPSTSPVSGTSPSTSPVSGTSPSTSPVSGTSPSTSPVGGTSPSTSPVSGTSPSTSPVSGTSPSTSPVSGTSPSTSPVSGASRSTQPVNGQPSRNTSLPLVTRR